MGLSTLGAKCLVDMINVLQLDQERRVIGSHHLEWTDLLGSLFEVGFHKSG